MALFLQIVSYVLTAIAAIAVYEAVRAAVKRRLKRRFRRDVERFLGDSDLYAQRFKFVSKDVVRQVLLSDPELHRKMLEYAEREGEDLGTVRDKVDGYIEEIVPEFNLLSYFKIGYTVARAFIHGLYDPVVDRERRRVLESLPPDASPVYVMNHRSNVDFVLLSYVLAGKVSISYAVGEWARVWPLEHLFKSFGSYFVRRGYKEDLYHKVLERYVQLLAKHGVVQAVFPEGGLTRDGRLLPAKLGLLGWLARVELEPDFARRLVFVPIGVNYDRVIEDKNLVREAQGLRKGAGFWKKAYVVLIGPFVSLGLLVVNGTRFLLGRLKLHGHAALSFGEPLYLREHLGAPEGGAPDAALIAAAVPGLGAEIMTRIGAAVPATSVTVVAVTMLENPRDTYPFGDLVALAQGTVTRLHAAGTPIVIGDRFLKFRHALHGDDASRHADGRSRERPGELADIDAAMRLEEETEALVDHATSLLVRNRILVRRGKAYALRPGGTDRLRYYANGVAHRIGGGWGIGPTVAKAATKVTGSTQEPGAPSGDV